MNLDHLQYHPGQNYVINPLLTLPYSTTTNDYSQIYRGLVWPQWWLNTNYKVYFKLNSVKIFMINTLLNHKIRKDTIRDNKKHNHR